MLWHFLTFTFRSSFPDVSSESRLLAGAEGMGIIVLANAACTCQCSVFHVCCYQ